MNSATLEKVAEVLNVPAGYFFDGWIDEQQQPDMEKEVAHLKELMAEKGRLISVLMERSK